MKSTNETLEDICFTDPPQNIYNPLHELEIILRKNDQEDHEELTYLITKILTFPSTSMAELHMCSDRLGTRDLRENLKRESSSGKENVEFCPCCGFARQIDGLKLCTRLESINNIGISTYLYFETIKNLIILLVIMSALYSVYSLVTNILASEVYDKIIKEKSTISSLISTTSYVSLSLGSKQLNPTEENKQYYFIQCWIGVAVVIVWLLMFFVLKFFEKSSESKVEEETISASDFTIAIENTPTDITKEELQDQLNKYEETLGNIPSYMKKPLKIAKINIGKPFFLNEDDFEDKELERLKEQHESMKETFIEWIKHRQNYPQFLQSKEERKKLYNEFLEISNRKNEIYKYLSEKIEQKIKKGTFSETRTTVFVTFESSQAMKLMSRLNDPSFISKIRYYLTCCQNKSKFSFYRGSTDMKVKIERAPEPEDIIWMNIGVPTCEIVKRKIITFSVTLLLLGISFGIVFGLSKAKQNTNNSILSLAISLSVSLINIILGVVIRLLTTFEKDYTETNHQTSLAIKSILASLINSILIPVIVNYYIKEDIYGENGLSSDVFMLGLTNSFVSPILKIVDISYIMNRLLKWRASRIFNKLASDQKTLNEAFEYMGFEVGYEYVYLVSLFLFTCFFVSLQPIISFFAMMGMGLMYWSQKYSLFNKMKRPVPGTDLVNITMFQLIICGGMIYSLGSLTWSNLIPGGIPEESLIPNLVSMGVSLTMIILPYNAILILTLSEESFENHEFEKCRILLPSEYDRLNPNTADQGLKDFQEFYDKEIKNLQNSSDIEKKYIIDLFTKQNARGHSRPKNAKNMLNSLFQGNQNLIPILPKMLESSIFLPESSNFKEQQPAPNIFGFLNQSPQMKQSIKTEFISGSSIFEPSEQKHEKHLVVPDNSPFQNLFQPRYSFQSSEGTAFSGPSFIQASTSGGFGDERREKRNEEERNPYKHWFGLQEPKKSF